MLGEDLLKQVYRNSVLSDVWDPSLDAFATLHIEHILDAFAEGVHVYSPGVSQNEKTLFLSFGLKRGHTTALLRHLKRSKGHFLLLTTSNQVMDAKSKLPHVHVASIYDKYRKGLEQTFDRVYIDVPFVYYNRMLKEGFFENPMYGNTPIVCLCSNVFLENPIDPVPIYYILSKGF